MVLGGRNGMGVIKFRLPPNDIGRRLASQRKAYMTGLDRTPGRLGLEFRDDLMLCTRESGESARLFVPWPIAGFGAPFVGTATLGERPEPYALALELARGKLNDVRNQAADWTQMGLRVGPDFTETLRKAHRAFVRAAVSGDDADVRLAASRESLAESSRAGDLLTDAYAVQVLQTRLASTGKLTTSLGCSLAGDPDKTPGSARWSSAMNAAQVGVSWRDLAPTEGKYRWELLDAQIAWCRKHRLKIEAGPLIEFRPSTMPDWIWLWAGDAETIAGFATDLARQAVARYRGKVPVWRVVHRPAGHDLLGLGEEDQIRITARVIQAARQADPAAQLCLGVDRPWAEWMSSSRFQLGPLHLCDYLIRSEVGLSCVSLEIAPGYSSPGSHYRDLFEFSRLLDLYALLNVPLHVTLVAPSADGHDPRAESGVEVEAWQWPEAPNEALQADWAARWAALAIAKPFVRSVSWLQPGDAVPHLYPHGGLHRADGTPKPAFSRIQALRRDLIA